MELSPQHIMGIFYLLVGGAIILAAIVGFSKQESNFLGLVLGLFLGAGFAGLGFLDLTKLIAPAWAGVYERTIWGFFLVSTALFSHPHPKFPNWTKWACFALGVGSLSLALLQTIMQFAHS